MNKLIACLALAVALTTVALGVDDKSHRATLKGIRGVEVLVEGFSEAEKSVGFDRRIFQTDVELKLRLAGIKVLTDEERLATPGRPYLYLNVKPLSPAKRGPYAIQSRLQQRVWLDRDPSIGSYATTWSIGSVGNGDIPYIREAVKDRIDQFINAWLSVNPSN